MFCQTIRNFRNSLNGILYNITIFYPVFLEQSKKSLVLFFLYFWANLERHSGHEGLEYTCGPVRASPKINNNGLLH
jgi:hypothetical protein